MSWTVYYVKGDTLPSPFVWVDNKTDEGCLYTVSIGHIGKPPLVSSESTRPRVELTAKDLSVLEVGCYYYEAFARLSGGRSVSSMGKFLVVEPIKNKLPDESDLTDDEVTQMYDEATPVEVERGWLCAERWRGPIPDGSDSLAFHLCLEPQGHQGQHLCTCGANP